MPTLQIGQTHSNTQNISNCKKETVSIITFKKWPSANDFRIETEDRKVLSALCKYCSKVEYNNCMQEDSTLKLICFFKKVLNTFIEVYLPVM